MARKFFAALVAALALTTATPAVSEAAAAKAGPVTKPARATKPAPHKVRIGYSVYRSVPGQVNQFVLVGRYNTHRQAQQVANRLRHQGFVVRIAQ